MELWPGRPYPPGATWDGEGTNFALFSEAAHGVELCLFGDRGGETRIPLTEVTAHTWHGYVPGVSPGQLYGYRVYGPYLPERGFRWRSPTTGRQRPGPSGASLSTRFSRASMCAA